MKKQPFPRKKNTFGLGFLLQTPPAKQQGSQSQRQPRPSLAFVEHRARSELNKGCDPEPSRTGAEVCSPSTVSLFRKQLLEARSVP